MVMPCDTRTLVAAIGASAMSLGLSAQPANQSGDQGARRGFTVADSIQMTPVVVPDRYLQRDISQDVPTSPDGARFAIVTKKGDLKRGCNDYSLLVFEIENVRASIPTKWLPTATKIAGFCSYSNRPGITDVRWLSDSQAVTFLGDNSFESAIVFNTLFILPPLSQPSITPTYSLTHYFLPL